MRGTEEVIGHKKSHVFKSWDNLWYIIRFLVSINNLGVTMQDSIPEILSVQVDKPYILKASQFRKVKAPMQLALGRKGFNEFKIEGFDPIPIYAEMTKSAHWLYWSLMQVRNPKTNIGFLRNQMLTDVERKKLARAYKELEEYNLLVRVKQETYLFNPKATLPMEGNYVEVWNRWFDIRGNKA